MVHSMVGAPIWANAEQTHREVCVGRMPFCQSAETDARVTYLEQTRVRLVDGRGWLVLDPSEVEEVSSEALVLWTRKDLDAIFRRLRVGTDLDDDDDESDSAYFEDLKSEFQQQIGDLKVGLDAKLQAMESKVQAMDSKMDAILEALRDTRK